MTAASKNFFGILELLCCAQIKADSASRRQSRHLRTKQMAENRPLIGLKRKGRDDLFLISLVTPSQTSGPPASPRSRSRVQTSQCGVIAQHDVARGRHLDGGGLFQLCERARNSLDGKAEIIGDILA